MAIRIGDYILTGLWKDKKFKVTNKGVGFKKDCFETEIGEFYFLDNRFRSWSRVKTGREKK